MKERERKGWASSKLSSWAHGTRLAWADPGPKQLYWPKKMLMSRAASSQLDHPLGSTTSSMYVKANTTRAKRPQARPRYSCPLPVTLQSTNEKPLLSEGAFLFWAVKAPWCEMACSSHACNQGKARNLEYVIEATLSNTWLMIYQNVTNFSLHPFCLLALRSSLRA
jgi:hypothetical protein